MCNDWCLEFIKSNLHHVPSGATVLEVGARDVNGSVRALLQPVSSEYTGVDIEAGPGVDQILDAENLVMTFGEARFDFVISTEMVEHVRNWPVVFTQLLSVVKPGGLLAITTRSPGFEMHGYPEDYWRYTQEDMKTIFSGVASILDMRDDYTYGYPSGVGVLVRRNESALESWRHELVNHVALFQIDCEQTVRFAEYSEIEDAIAEHESGQGLVSVLERIIQSPIQANPCNLDVVVSENWLQELQRSLDYSSVIIEPDPRQQAMLLPILFHRIHTHGLETYPLRQGEQTMLFLAAHGSGEILRRAVLASSIKSNCRSVIVGHGGAIVFPLQEQQSRIANAPIDFWVLNTNPESGCVSIDVRLSEHQEFMIQWNGHFLHEPSLYSEHCHQGYSFQPFLCPPGCHRLRVLPSRFPFFLTRFVVSASPCENAEAVQDSILQARRAWEDTHQSELDRYRDALEHWQEEHKRLQDHAENQQRILDEVKDDLKNHKILLAEAQKHIRNLESAEEKPRQDQKNCS